MCKGRLIIYTLRFYSPSGDTNFLLAISFEPDPDVVCLVTS